MGLLAAASPPPRGGAMGPMVPVVDQQDSPEGPWAVSMNAQGFVDPCPPLVGAMGTQRDKESTSCTLVGSPGPDGPPLTLGFVPVRFAGKFADILGIDCL